MWKDLIGVFVTLALLAFPILVCYWVEVILARRRLQQEWVRWIDGQSVDTWIEALDHELVEIRQAALVKLQEIPGEPVVRALLNAAVHNRDAAIRTAAQEALLSFPQEVVVCPLIAALSGEPVEQAILAAKQLGQRKIQEAVGPLEAVWHSDQSSELRGVAGVALVRIGVSNIIDELIELLEEEGKSTPQTVIGILQEWSRSRMEATDTKDWERLTRILTVGADKQLSAEAAQALRRCGQIETLMDQIQAENGRVRNAVIEALKRWAQTAREKDEKTTELLLFALHHTTDPELALAAAQRLQERGLITTPIGLLPDSPTTGKAKSDPAVIRQEAAATALRPWPRQVRAGADEETVGWLLKALTCGGMANWRWRRPTRCGAVSGSGNCLNSCGV